MNRFAIYDLITGRIIQLVQAPSEDVADMLQNGQGLIQTDIGSPGRCYVDVALDQVVNMPERPSPTHIWDWSSHAWSDARSIGDKRAEKWAQIKKARNQAEFGTFTWDGSTFDSDAVSQSRIQGAVLLASQLGEAFSQEWTLADNTQRTLNAAQMLQVGMALATHINQVHAHGRQLRAQINAADAEALAALHWDV
jgi:hypothetical protein